MEQQTKDVIVEMRDLNKENMLSLDQRFFMYEQKVKEVLVLKEEFKRGQVLMDESKAYITKLCEDSITTMTNFKSESLETISKI